MLRKSRQLEPVTLDNIRDYTFSQAGGYERWMSMLNYQYNNEPEAMRDIMMIYGGLRRPILVLFLTDGRLQSDWEIEEILIKDLPFPRVLAVHRPLWRRVRRAESPG